MNRRILWIVLCFSFLLHFPVTAAQYKMVAFTFDDGPDPVQTAKLLDGLQERNAKATFFVVGMKIDPAHQDARTQTNIQLIQRMQAEGHEIGNHTYTHCYLSKASREQVRQELSKTSTILENITGEKPKYMRPPGGGGLTAPWVREIASPMITVCWSGVDTRDWECRDVPKMVDKIVSSVRDGSIVLLHDNYATSVETAFLAMDRLAQEGYQFVTVDTLLSRNLGTEYQLNPMRIYSAMYPGDLSRLQKKELS